MSTYVLMRILESGPRRYELGIRLLTLGRLDAAYDRLASRVEPGQRVLDIGCGTGALTLRAARRGAKVKGIDINPEMLAIAEQHVTSAGLAESVELAEMGVAELGGEEAQRYDAVMSGLCLSELSADELRYALTEIARILRPGGLVLVADEITPQGSAARSLHALIRAPLAALTYLVAQQTTHPVSQLPERLQAVGFATVSVRSDRVGSFGEFVVRKPAGAAS